MGLLIKLSIRACLLFIFILSMIVISSIMESFFSIGSLNGMPLIIELLLKATAWIFLFICFHFIIGCILLALGMILEFKLIGAYEKKINREE